MDLMGEERRYDIYGRRKKLNKISFFIIRVYGISILTIWNISQIQ